MSHEKIQQAIDDFAAAETKQMNEVLLTPIKEIARTGSVCYKWQTLMILLLHQLRLVLESGTHPTAASAGGEALEGLAGDDGYEDSCNRLYGLLESFEGPPFTIQRICELLLRPHQHHKTKRKLLFALDKLLSVTSIVAEDSPPSSPIDGVSRAHLSNHAPSDSPRSTDAHVASVDVEVHGGNGAERRQCGPSTSELSDSVMTDEGLSNGSEGATRSVRPGGNDEMQTDPSPPLASVAVSIDSEMAA